METLTMQLKAIYILKCDFCDYTCMDKGEMEQHEAGHKLEVKLKKHRQSAIDKGIKLLTEDEVIEEVSKRRGDRR